MFVNSPNDFHSQQVMTVKIMYKSEFLDSAEKLQDLATSELHSYMAADGGRAGMPSQSLCVDGAFVSQLMDPNHPVPLT